MIATLAALLVSVAAHAAPLVPLPDEALMLGREVPPVAFVDEAGRRRTLGELKGQPVFVLPIFTACESTCPRVAAALKHALLDAGVDAREIQVFLFSFDPADMAEDLARFRKSLSLPASWTIARLDRDAIGRLTRALDFHSARADGAWLHPNVVGVLSADLRLAKYLYGVSFTRDDIKGALRIAQGAADWRTKAGPYVFSAAAFLLVASSIALTFIYVSRL